MSIRAYADNSFLLVEPLPTQTESGIQLARSSTKRRDRLRAARVVLSGPGYTNRNGHFVPPDFAPGTRVLIDELAGDLHNVGFSVPRHNKDNEFHDLLGDAGQYRVVRHDEVVAVIGDDVRVE